MSEVKVDTISERTAAGGVTIDGVLIKDNTVTATGTTVLGTVKITGGSPGADKVLTSDADGDATWEDASSGGFIKYTVYTGNHTWLKSANSPTKVVVEVQGAGGGGGGSHSAYSTSGGSGGAGGYCRKYIDVSGVTQALIVVGSGGAGGAQAVNGAAGGASSWIDTASGGSSTITGSGGGAGLSWSANSGGAGGGASGGDIEIPGTNGTSNAVGTWSEAGSFMGMPNVQQVSSTNKTGLPGIGYGGQGQGGTGPGVYSGGDGADGVVVVYEYA